MNEVVNGLMAAHQASPDLPTPMLAVVPGGSTNVFARAMGMDPDPVLATEQILEALIVRQPTRTISLGRVDDRYFTFNSGLGLDAEVVKAVEDRRATGKKISNSLHVRKAVREYFRSERRRPRLTLTVDGGTPIEGVHLVFVSNVRSMDLLRVQTGTDQPHHLGGRRARPVRSHQPRPAERAAGHQPVAAARRRAVLPVTGTK